MTLVTVVATERSDLPEWAVRQRQIIARMDDLAEPFVEHCTRPDGSLELLNRTNGMHGTDNAYETFLSFPLFFLLGGGQHVRKLGQQEWDAITRQFTEFGPVEREFVAGFDWFHHGESYPYFFYLALGDPGHALNRQRAAQFADMYTGEDPLAPNWDAEQCMIRSPLNGSRGPVFILPPEAWENHRGIFSNYLAPYEDVLGEDGSDPLYQLDWTDDETFSKVLAQINERMTRGDVPLNLGATCLVTHAYIHTAEDRYRQWVLDYVGAWMERRDANNGIVPDNVGPNGRIGQLMDGKWWGGYYGWRWPHGARNIVESTLAAGACALLMTGDTSYLDLGRSQLDLLWSLRKEEDGVAKVPARHGDRGWFDYRPVDPYYYIHLHYLSQSPEDLARIDEIFPDRAAFVPFEGNWGARKGGNCPPMSWFAFNEGRYPEYPVDVAQSTDHCIDCALKYQRDDDSEPEQREPHHFQPQNPVAVEATLQMTMGTPAAIYNGGMLQAHVRYFDPQCRRAGLPESVAALAQDVSATGICVTLVNTNETHERTVLIQSGTFAEHEFTEASLKKNDGPEETIKVNDRYMQVKLGPASQACMQLGVKRYVHRPTYYFPPI